MALELLTSQTIFLGETTGKEKIESCGNFFEHQCGSDFGNRMFANERETQKTAVEVYKLVQDEQCSAAGIFEWFERKLGSFLFTRRQVLRFATEQKQFLSYYTLFLLKENRVAYILKGSSGIYFDEVYPASLPLCAFVSPTNVVIPKF